MTTKEEKTIHDLLQLARDLKTENQKFREDISTQMEAINTKTEKKHLPIYHEQDILKTAQQSIADALKSVMTGYNSPLSRLVASVVEENSTELKGLISDSFTKVIRTEDFKQSIVNAFSHKVARTIISNNDGLFDKVANELKQDAIFKSKMSLAVANVVEECLREKQISPTQ